MHDADRTAFFEGHLRAAHAAIEAGADLRGFLVWSLLDNFEWAEGYHKRFGIVHVDFETQRRLPKDSALWYREVIRHNGLHRERAKRPTLEAVAARAGVSRSTVSRVINGEGTVSDEFRAIVMHAVNELGYVPNSAARSLVTRRTDSIALVVSGSPVGARSDDPLFSATVRSATRELEEAGKRVTLMLADSTAGRLRVEQYAASGHVDGVVLVSAQGTDPLPAALARTGIPVVSLGRPTVATHAAYADVDNVGGATSAVEHLLAGGRRRIAAIAGPPDMVAAQDRLKGYREALRDTGHRSIIAVGDLTLASGADAMRQLLRDDPALDAVFVAGDLMAIGALRVLSESGRRVPDDVAIAGFDDIEAASYAVPALTTVRTPREGQARAAVRLLLRQIDGGPVSSTILPTELVIREST
ncbi:LacI family DNA-binding transcriptional regulator [Streptosporangium vulgare]|uniref:LacI family DNA-binding transcriptional regulator n=1 Tax=Streptosporangium vulgare TaxID=46190 RepID=UPI0031CE05DC